jgi:CMP-N,N'-diacetyllegionaminic acid synthase
MTDNLMQFVTNQNSTLKDALIQMTSTHRGILLVVDSDFYLVGVVADGDIRRALLDDVSLSIPITQIMNLNPTVAENEDQARKILNENPFYILIPVIDSNGKLTGVLSALNGKQFYADEGPETNKQGDSVSDEKKVRFLAIIPARGGSKRIPDKNLSRIGKDTLLSLAIKSAVKSDYIDHISVSTDSEEIADEARKFGVDVPRMRPEELSGDSAKTVDVMIHELEMFRKNHNHDPEFIVLLEPTAPLRSASLLDNAIEKFLASDADSLVSVNKIRHIYHPEELLVASDKEYLKPYLEGRTFDTRKLRGDQEELFIQNGLVYITRTPVLSNQKSIYGSKVLRFETPEMLFADIDEKDDLEMARIKYNKLSPLK